MLLMTNAISIDGALVWSEIAAIGGGGELVLSQRAIGRIANGAALVAAIVAQGVRAYGVNTGVGALCNVIIDPARQSALSRNILMSHACGVGAPLGQRETRAVMAAAINNFAHGGSGVRLAVVERLAALLNAGCIPVAPSRGSVGYLSHMAHIALPLIGEGWVVWNGEALAGGEALARLGLSPLVLQAKEGLSLINGAPCATGMASIALARLEGLMDWADAIAAMTFETLGGQPVAFAAEPLAFRVSDGVARVGGRLRAMLAGSEILARAPLRTQDAMSLRAIPQVHGAVFESWRDAGAVVDRELASVNDNPIVAGSPAAPVAYAQAHPIATALALALDGLGVAVAKIAAMSERRIDRLLNPLVSGLPAFLAQDGGVCSGLMIAQYTALSLVSENRRLAAPASLDGGITSGLQEDEIPHATPAALKALQIVDNCETILAIELLAAAQACEFHDPDYARAPATDALYRAFRGRVAPYRDDRPLADGIAAAAAFIGQACPVDLSTEGAA
jgi:histidine ammonia-lyase